MSLGSTSVWHELQFRGWSLRGPVDAGQELVFAFDLDDQVNGKLTIELITRTARESSGTRTLRSPATGSPIMQLWRKSSSSPCHSSATTRQCSRIPLAFSPSSC